MMQSVSDNSRLVIGCAQFGMPYGLIRNQSKLAQDQVQKVLLKAYENGIRALDTAEAYGDSEEKCVKAVVCTNPRAWDFTTKISPVSKNIPERVAKLTKSLRGAKTNILAHSATEYIESERFRSELLSCKQISGVRKIGVSVYTKRDIESVFEKHPPDLLQVPVNLLDKRLVHDGFLEQVWSSGVEVHARSVFLQGMFFSPIAEIGERFPEVLDSIEKLSRICVKEQVSLSQLALAWLRQVPGIDRLVIGVSSVRQLKANVQAFKWEISEEAYKAVMDVQIDNETVLDPRLW